MIDPVVTASISYELVLTGGPCDVRPECAPGGRPSSHVKVPWCGGYEHYTFSGSYQMVGDRSLPVFNWVYRTLIAE